MKHTIDATGKSLGRVATQAAVILMGKDTTSFARHIAPETTVSIINAGKVRIGARKQAQKTYKSFSGYPGGLKERSMAHVVAGKGHAELVRIAVHGMLPKNKLRDRMLKHLHVSD